jgi:hypothetical protein
VLARERIIAWPFPGAIGLIETAHNDCYGRPCREWLLVNNWSFLGSFPDRDSARVTASDPAATLFDRDAYRILVRALAEQKLQIIDVESGQALANPFAVTGNRT